MKWKWRNVFWTGGSMGCSATQCSICVYLCTNLMSVKSQEWVWQHASCREKHAKAPRVCDLKFFAISHWWHEIPVVLWFLWKAPVCMLYTETNDEPCEELSLRGLIGMVWHDPIMKFHIWNLNFTWIPKHISLSSGSCLHSIFNFQEYMFVNLAHNTF